MQCKECQNRFPQFLLGELDDDAEAEISQHLGSGCARCNQQFAELSDTVGFLIAEAANETTASPTADLKDAGAQVWQGIQNRIADNAHRSAAPTAQPSPTDRDSQGRRHEQRRDELGFGWKPIAGLLVAVAAGFLVTSMIRMAANPDLEILGFGTRDNSIVAQSGGGGLRGPGENATNGEFGDPSDLRTVSLRHVEQPQRQCGLIVFDSFAAQIHLYLSGLPTLSTGEQYVFWFGDADGHWLSGTPLQVDRGGVSQLIEVPPSDSPLNTVITIERGPQTPQPHGKVAIISDDKASEAAADDV
ncbi:zf-HC2 domain-containing protein [Stieleria sp. TO1_6]|uniref:anti-sigma factor family protein n=1 Tax=Stieleria tagensis TaxID=2956795 RepID=UPI00209AD2CD|nr:anti-sigma factor [Stieleria tagensis]MCO8123189.1 zf-HC2 domain-containing protein [Stieleria tagensis]